jgi:hypothetical protein
MCKVKGPFASFAHSKYKIKQTKTKKLKPSIEE